MTPGFGNLLLIWMWEEAISSLRLSSSRHLARAESYLSGGSNFMAFTSLYTSQMRLVFARRGLLSSLWYQSKRRQRARLMSSSSRTLPTAWDTHSVQIKVRIIGRGWRARQALLLFAAQGVPDVCLTTWGEGRHVVSVLLVGQRETPHSPSQAVCSARTSFSSARFCFPHSLESGTKEEAGWLGEAVNCLFWRRRQSHILEKVL